MSTDSLHKQQTSPALNTGYLHFWRRPLPSFPPRECLWTVVIVALCTLVCWFFQFLEFADVIGMMVYLAGVVFIAARFGHGPAILGSVLSVLSFLFFFIPPIFGFQVADTQYFVVLAVMLGTGLLISELTAQLQSQLRAARQREHRTAQLHQLTLRLNENVGVDSLLKTARACVSEILASEVMIYLCRDGQSPVPAFGQNTSLAGEPQHQELADWVATNGRPAGARTEAFSTSSVHYVPMIGSERTIGVLAARRADASPLDEESCRMLATCANLIALSIERDQSREEAQRAQVMVHTEQLRNSLLNAVSHDLRTPLATIAVTASSLLQSDAIVDPEVQRENLQVVVDESNRLARQVDNLLEMAQLDSGAVMLQGDWHVLEELVGIAVKRMRSDLKGASVAVHIPNDFPLLWVSDGLVVELLVNVLDNAVRYAGPGCRIEITANRVGGSVEIRIADNGPGLPPGSEKLIFDRFVRASAIVPDGQRGMGLGLAICRSIAELHGGQISAANRPAGGAEFVVTLPHHEDSSPTSSPTREWIANPRVDRQPLLDYADGY